jgi:ankyrin repeat protein
VTLFILILSVIVLAIIALIVYMKYESVPLFKAIKRNRTQEALTLIKQGVDVNVKNSSGETSLLCAARAGNAELSKALIESGADLNAQLLVVGRSALMEAAGKGHADIVRLLIEAGADVNANDWVGTTALMEAVASGSKEAVDDLLGAGADTNAKHKDGRTALFIALSFNRTDIAWALIKAGAEVTVLADRGPSTLDYCFVAKEYEMAEALLDDQMLAGLDINAEDSDGLTILTKVVSTALREEANGSHPLLNIIRKLVKAGADLDLALAIANEHYAPAFFDKYKRDIIDILRSG